MPPTEALRFFDEKKGQIKGNPLPLVGTNIKKLTINSFRRNAAFDNDQMLNRFKGEIIRDIGDKFPTKTDAPELVKNLYNHGADMVLVEKIWATPAIIRKYGGPIGHWFRIELPENSEKRQELLAFIEKEQDSAYFEKITETNQRELFMVWF